MWAADERRVSSCPQDYKDRFFYQLYFQEPGVAEAELEADVRRSLRKIYYWASGEAIRKGFKVDKPADARLLDGLLDPEPFPAWLTPADLDYYVGELQRRGFCGHSTATAHQSYLFTASCCR